MLPGVEPTEKYVGIPHVIIMKFAGSKIAHEHIYWNQSSVLVQIGLIEEKNIPVTGIQQARRILELTNN